MCPSFSLCAWRILKMRSCLRSPLAPGSSRDRAILVSSVMFFSFSSAMVVCTYGIDFSGGILFVSRGDGLLCRRAGHTAELLSSSPLCFGKVLGFTQNFMTFRISDLVKNLFHRLLNAGVRPMELPRRLRGELAEHVPVPQSMKSIKYAIRTHVRSFSFKRNNLGSIP